MARMSPLAITAGIILALVTCLVVLSPGFAADLDGLLDDPSAARGFDYCNWAHGDPDRTRVAPDVQAMMKAPAGERTIAAAVLVDAGATLSLATTSEKACRRELKKGFALFDKALRRHTQESGTSGGIAPSDDSSIADVQTEINRLWNADQAARRAYIDLQTKDTTGAGFWAHRLAVSHATLADFAASNYMKEILQSFDWIDSVRFGLLVSRQAWTLVQHADDHPEFQKQALTRMEAYWETGGVLPQDYAHLWDRVAVNSGQLQRYGTQPIWKCENGRLALQPMEDPENVNERRARMGMASVESDLAEMARNTCR